MKFRYHLFTFLLGALSLSSFGQCSADFYYYNSGSTFTFVDSSITPTGSHQLWMDFGDGNSTSSLSATHTYSNAGTYTVCLTVWDSTACTDTICKTITVSGGTSCSPSSSYSVDSLNPMKYYFYGSTPPSGYSVQWVISEPGGGNTTYTTQNATHTFGSTGWTQAHYFMYDASGNFCDSTILNLNVQGTSTSCNASFTYTQDSLDGTIFYFNGSNPPSGGSSKYDFYPSGGGSYTINAQNTTRSFLGNGYMYVAYTVYDASGNICDTASQYVQWNTGCNANYTYTIDSSNALKYYFQANSVPSGGSVSWAIIENGSITGSYTTANPTHTFAGTGVHEVMLILWNSSSSMCDSINSTINVGGGCSPSFTYQQDSTNPFKFDFYGGPLYGGSASWVIYDGGSYSYPTGQNITHTFNWYGNKLVTYMLYDANGNFCDSTSQWIYIQNPCNASYYYVRDSLNLNTYYFYGSTPASGGSSRWFIGDGSGGSTPYTTQNVTHTFSSNGTKNIYYEILDANGNVCDSSAGSVNVNSGGGTVCNASATYYQDSTNALKYYFFGSSIPAGGSASYTMREGTASTNYMGVNATHTFNTSGAKYVTYFLYDSLGNLCDSIDYTININTVSCSASFYLAVDTTNLYNLYIINNSTGTHSGTSYSWNFGDGNTSTAQSPTHQYATYGLYNLCLTISDTSGCQSTYCDSIGLDSNGQLLKAGFTITVLNQGQVGVEEVKTLTGFNVYPNPSNGLVNISLDAKEYKHLAISVTNTVGQQLLEVEEEVYTGKNTLTLNLAELNEGMYFINMRSGNELKTMRVFLNK